MGNELFVKKGRRYVPVGEEFDGFPAPGWWVVADSHRNLVVPIDEPRPLPKLQYRRYANDIINEMIIQKCEYSLAEMVNAVLDSLQRQVEAEAEAKQP